MSNTVARYEVTESNGSGEITDTRTFGPHRLSDAIEYRRQHPQSQGWTIRRSGRSGGESSEPGLHER